MLKKVINNYTLPQDPEWRARESAVLALGAISEGCHRGLVPFMGPMVTMLTPKLSDERPLVRGVIPVACMPGGMRVDACILSWRPVPEPTQRHAR